MPRFVRQYARLSTIVVNAARTYVDDVRKGRFPPAQAQGRQQPDVIETIEGMRGAVREARARGHVIGLVPTMGALHEGHGKLIERARTECGFVAVSVFVNPIQFNQASDYQGYPRALARDVEFCAARGVDVVFAPGDAAMYPEPSLTFVEPTRITDHLCGARRPGHFKGVATVVAKLLNIVQPDRAYFGEKDAQQLAMIKRMVKDLDLPVEIVGVETVREPDGLAMSSRNCRLEAGERRLALALYRALRTAADRIASGATDPRAIEREAAATIPEDRRVRLEYLEIVEPETLQPVEQVAGPVRVAGALWVGDVRLIDNLLVERG